MFYELIKVCPVMIGKNQTINFLHENNEKSSYKHKPKNATFKRNVHILW